MLLARGAQAGSILFIGNSFTFAHGSPVMYYRSGTVSDLNGQGLGGVPALFKSFADQAGLNYQVSLETHPGVGLDWHLKNKASVIGQRTWDVVVLQSLSTLDDAKPGDPALLVDSVRRLAALFRGRNAQVELRLTATWPRADLTYVKGGAWYGQPIEAMAHDVRAGYDLAAAGIRSGNGTGTGNGKGNGSKSAVASVIPVGDAWIRAMHEGVAVSNPYDGIEPGKLDLWTHDFHHASTFGYYLEALMVFGGVTGRDPRSLSDAECSGYELGLSRAQVAALEQVAFEQLTVDRLLGVANHAISDASAAINSAAGMARASGAPRPAHCAP